MARLAVSPNGKKIAFALGVWTPLGQSYTSVREFSFRNVQEKKLGGQKWLGIAGLVWLHDGNSLILNGTDGAHQSFQFWKNYPNGKARKITNDSNGFHAGQRLPLYLIFIYLII